MRYIGQVIAALFFFRTCLLAEDVMRVQVDAMQMSRHLLRSTIDLPAKPGPFSFHHPEWISGIHGPSEQVRNIGGLEVFAEDGTRLVWRRDTSSVNQFHVEVPEPGSKIRVELTYLPNQPTRVSTGVDSYGNADLLVINMNTCIVYPNGQDLRKLPVDFSVTLPAEYRFATALRRKGAENGRQIFNRTTVETLVDSPLIAGRHYRRLDIETRDFPTAGYHFVSESSKALEFDEQQAECYKRLMSEAYALFGGAPFETYDFLVVCSDDIPHMGLEHHESSLNAVDQRAIVDIDKRKGSSASLLPHELVHAWCGKYRRPAGMYRADFHTPMQTSELWIYEGLTQYLGHLLTIRAGFLAFEEHLERTASRIGYLANRVGRQWRPLEDTAITAYTLRGGSENWADLRRSQDYYDEGAFFWLEADATIRRLTSGKSSLDDFCCSFFSFEKGDPKVKTFEVGDVVEALDALADYDWAGLIDRRIRMAQTEMSFEGLRAVGYEFVLVPKKPDYVEYRERDREFISAEFSLGLSIKNNGSVNAIVPNGIADKAGLAEGMKVLGVNGLKFNAQRLNHALEDSVLSGKLELLVEQGDAYRSVLLQYDGGPRYPAIVPMEGQSDLFRQICSPRKGTESRESRR